MNFEESKQELSTTFDYIYDFGDPNDRKVLADYNDFSRKLLCFKIAQEEKNFDIVQPVVNVETKNYNINGVFMISAIYILNKSMFSNKIKTDEFMITVQKHEEDGIQEYYWFTANFEELDRIFYEFIVNKKTPDTSNFDTI